MEFTPEMHREFATVLTMLLTGKMDQQVVDVPGSDGHSGFVLMDPKRPTTPPRCRKSATSSISGAPSAKPWTSSWTASRGPATRAPKTTATEHLSARSLLRGGPVGSIRCQARGDGVAPGYSGIRGY